MQLSERLASLPSHGIQDEESKKLYSWGKFWAKL